MTDQPRFIQLTATRGDEIRVAVAHIGSYTKRSNCTSSVIRGPLYEELYYVQETPEEIDAVLGTPARKEK